MTTDLSSDDLAALVERTRECMVCDGMGYKETGTMCGACHGEGERPWLSTREAALAREVIALRAVVEAAQRWAGAHDPDGEGLSTALLASPAPTEGRRVRELEWTDHGCGIWSAEAFGMTFYQMTEEAPDLYELDTHPDTEFTSLAAAKAAAQADFAARVLACLSPAPAVPAPPRALDLSPWEHSSGPVPDYDSPLGPVFDSGVTYTLGLLAEALDAKGYSLDGATETHDGDVLAAITSILYHADPKWLREYLDENLHPSTEDPNDP